MNKTRITSSLGMLTRRSLAVFVAVATALGMVIGFVTPAFAATKYVETGSFERGKNYVLVAATQSAGSGYAIQHGSSNQNDGAGGRTSLPSFKLSISEGSVAFVVVDDAKLVWNARSVGNGGVQLYCDVDLEESNQDVDFGPSHYLYPSSTCLKTQDQGARDIRWQDSQLSVSTSNGSRYYITCDGNGKLGTATSGAATFRIFVEDDSPVPTEYTVKFVNYDGKELSSATYAAGTKADDIVHPATPTHPDDDEYTYAFIGWDKPLADVTADATYTALFSAQKKTQWVRLAGSGRYETMAEIVKEGFKSADVAVLATGKDFPDALVASSVAGAYEAPVILTKSDALSAQAKTLLENLGVKTVYIMGGESAVSSAVESAVKALGISTERVKGSSRQGTSLDAMQRLNNLGKFDGTVVIATGKNFADALAISPWCYKSGTPILLTKNNGTLTDDQVTACEDLGVTKAYIVGGTGVVDDKVIEQLGLVDGDTALRLAGSNRYETAGAIAMFELIQGMERTNAAVATGQAFPDALAGAALCGKNNSVLLLAKDKDSVSLQLVDKLAGIETGYVLGGTSAVSEELFTYLQDKVK